MYVEANGRWLEECLIGQALAGEHPVKAMQDKALYSVMEVPKHPAHELNIAWVQETLLDQPLYLQGKPSSRVQREELYHAWMLHLARQPFHAPKFAPRRQERSQIG